LFAYKNWDAKSNKTIDFLQEKYILNHLFSAVSLFLSSPLSNKAIKSTNVLMILPNWKNYFVFSLMKILLSMLGGKIS